VRCDSGPKTTQPPHQRSSRENGPPTWGYWFLHLRLAAHASKHHSMSSGELPVAEARRRLGMPEGGVAAELHAEIAISGEMAAALQREWRTYGVER
jgi:hypothetical protein